MEATRPTATTFTENKIEVDGFKMLLQEAGEGDLVVILDSMTGGLSELQDDLAQKYRVVVLKLPTSDGTPTGAQLPSASDLATTIGQVIAKTMHGTYTLIGASFGANVALWHALQEPDKLESLILVSPTAILPADTPTVPSSKEGLSPRIEGVAHDAESQRRLNEIQCPTLVVFGSKDNMVSPEAARAYRENIPNCNV